jgi:hypothetical protein
MMSKSVRYHLFGTWKKTEKSKHLKTLKNSIHTKTLSRQNSIFITKMNGILIGKIQITKARVFSAIILIAK